MAEALAKVSIGIAVWNGEKFLEKTLQSLLEQDYQNIEIIILDNQSTDSTPQICQRFAVKDSRVCYILDEELRDVMSAQKKVAHIASGDFYMVACDGDWYEPSYVSRLMNIIAKDPEVGLAYTEMGFIDEADNKSSAYLTNLFKRSDQPLKNFKRYLMQRDPVPIIFGIIRKNLHLDALNFYKCPDSRGWDHDNLYVMRLLTQTRVEGVPERLFYYRQQDRDALYKKRNQYVRPKSPLNIYLNHVLHQWAVTCAITKIIDYSKFNKLEKILLQISNYQAFFYYIRFKYLREPIKNSVTWKKIHSYFKPGED